MPAPLTVALLFASLGFQGEAALPLDLAAPRAVAGEFVSDHDGVLLRTPDRFDCIAYVGALDAARATIDVELSHQDGLLGGGLVFGSRERDRAPSFAQMIRFDGRGELLHGAFVRGQFEATGRLVLPVPIALGQRVRLSIALDAELRTMDVAVDGRAVGTAIPVRSTAGGVAVQGSLGRVRFHSISARGEPGPPRLAWPEAFEVRQDGFAVRSSAGHWFHLPRHGGDPVPMPAESNATPSSSVAPSEIRIVGGAIEIPGGGRFAGRALGNFDAIAVARDLDGTLIALDQCGARLVAVPHEGDERPDHLVFPSADRVRLVPAQPAFAVTEDGRVLGSTDARGEIAGLAPSTRYVLHVPLGYRCWPTDARFRAIPFTSPPPVGQLRVRRLRIVVGIFGNVAGDADDADALPAATDFDFARIEREFRDCAEWYFHHSGHRLWLEPHFVRRDEQTTTLALSSDGEPNGAPPRSLLEALAREAKLALTDVAGFCVVMDAKQRGGPDRPWRRIGGGGGLTLGAHGTGYGLSWFFVPETPGMVAWLACHELHHQLDAWFEISGMPEYPFNHFAPSLRNVAFFGEHWDGNAWILRTWPAHLVDALRCGDVQLVADRDGDGLPDGDARLPSDEDRFGSDPTNRDTDGDGLDDGQEARLGAWLRESGFESQLAPSLDPDPRHADTDDDGVGDLVDELPLLPFAPRLAEQSTLTLRTLEDPRLTAVTSLRLEDGGLEIHTASADAAAIDVQVLFDAGADGWFDGRDNLRIRSRGDSARVIEAFDASSRTEWPHADPERAKAFRVSARSTATQHVLRLELPETLRPGAVFGLAIAYRGHLTEPSDPRWQTVFEPHRLVRFSVVDPSPR